MHSRTAQGAFPYSDNALGISLVLLNIAIVPLIMRTTHKAIKRKAETKRYVARLHTQLLIDRAEDAWNKLKTENEDAAMRVLRGANDLSLGTETRARRVKG